MNRTWSVLLLALGLVAALLLAPTAARAGQDEGWKELQSQLSLSPEQVERMKPILKSYQDARKANLQAFKQRINAMLTPEQGAQLQQMRDEARSSNDRKGLLKRMITELGLTPGQIADLKSAISEHRERQKDNRERFLAEVRTVLTPDQFERFQSLLNQHEKH